MNIKKQNPGKKLSRNEMKNLVGGAMPPKFCVVIADCVGGCLPSDTGFGYICLRNRCTYAQCA
jgi:hypothetical protein